ncbi:MAG: YcnI family protein [Micromonosporaceae bacterium]
MIRRLCAGVLGAVVIAVLGYAHPAAAHVTVDPGVAVQGGYARVVFRVPNERDDASTVKVEVRLPEAHPVAAVRTMPVPGWKTAVKTRTLATPIERHGVKVNVVVSHLTWTAASKQAAIAPGQFLEFPVSLGPLPETATMVFPAVQTYSNREVVQWAEEPTGGEEPEHPAPVLTLAKPPNGNAAVPTGVTDRGTAAAPAATESDRDGGTPLWLGLVALPAALVALSLGGLAYLRTREVDEEDFDDEPDDELESDDEAEPEPPVRTPRRPSPK